MFFATYLWRELHRRMRQALVIAGGLALGIGLVITVTSLASGVAVAQAKVLGALYGEGTDITVMTPTTPNSGSGPVPGPEAQHHDELISTLSGQIASSQVVAVARLRGVEVAAGGLILTDVRTTIPALGAPPSTFEMPTQVSVAGVDLARRDLGPLSTGRIVSGRNFSKSEGQQDAAVIDSSYAAEHQLKVGSSVTVAGTPFTVIGIVKQGQDSNPPNIFIPLGRAQSLAKLDGFVNIVYVKAAGASEVDRVSNEISTVMPSAKVTNSSSLANDVSGSLADTANLATTLGMWLAILALLAAFAVASLLTMAAVARRAKEFGTLKALGWRSGRIIGQVVAESIAIGMVGAALGIALGIGGTSLASKAAPTLTATVKTTDIGQGGFGGDLGANGGIFHGTVGGPVQTVANPSASHTVAIPFSAPISLSMIALAVVLAITGGMVAGALGGWRAARLRPADALRQVG